MTTATATRRQNTYAGTCRTCGGHVAAGAGLLGPKVGGRWTVEHLGHPAGAATQPAPAHTAKPTAARKPRCAECGVNAGVVVCRDSSGITDVCCHRCAARPAYERSFN